jgi:ribosomal protein L16 Arg81 hydroxylase
MEAISVGSEFANVIAPVTGEEFISKYYEQRHLLLNRNDANYYTNLLALNDLDDFLELNTAITQRVYMVSAKHDIHREEYTLPDGQIDVCKAYRLFDEGATIIFPQMQEVLPSLSFLCRGAEVFFNCPFQTNIYFTPPGAQGFKTHYDTHDVFILQISGSKHWRLYESHVHLPLRGQVFDKKEHSIGDAIAEFRLDAGDLFYCPRGVPHDAAATGEHSLHITFGALAYTWADVMIEVMADLCLRNHEFRKSLPVGFAGSSADIALLQPTFRKLVGQFQEGAQLFPAISGIREKFISGRRELVPGQRRQILDLGDLTSDSWIGRRPGLIYFSRMNESELEVLHGSTLTKFPGHVADAVAFALEADRFRVREIPCALDGPSRLVLARRLIREGLVMTVK